MAKSIFALTLGLFLFGCAHQATDPTSASEKGDCKAIAHVSDKKECGCEQCKKDKKDCQCEHKEQCKHEHGEKKTSKKKAK